MKQAALIVPLVAALAACHSEPRVEANNGSGAEVASEIAKAAKDDPQAVRAGLWSTTLNVEKIDAPGVPPDVVQRMKGLIGSRTAPEICLTEEQAKNPSGKFFSGGRDQCTYDHFTMAHGKIDATMRCSEAGVSQIINLEGGYSPDTYRIRMSSQMQGDGPMGGMTMVMRVESRRVGECHGKTT